MIHSGNKTSFKTTFVIDDGSKPYNYTITKPAKNATATAAARATASAAAPTASGLGAQGHGGVGAVDRSDHGNGNSQPPADVNAWISAQQGRKTTATSSAPAAKGLRSKNFVSRAIIIAPCPCKPTVYVTTAST